MGSGKHLKNAINKHGPDNFKKEILFTFDNEKEMNDKERELVTIEFCKRKDTYNICEGGKGGFGYINSSGKNVNGSQTKGGIAAWNKIKNDEVLSQKHKDTSSKNLKNAHNSGKIKYDTRTGSIQSEETKQKIRKSQLDKDLKGSNNPAFGKIWITNDVESKMIVKEELQNWLNLGYRRGKTCSEKERFSNKNKGKKLTKLPKYDSI